MCVERWMHSHLVEESTSPHSLMTTCTTRGCMSGNRRVRSLSSFRNGNPLLRMKLGSNWRFLELTYRWEIHIHRVQEVPPICCGPEWNEVAKWMNWTWWNLCDRCALAPTYILGWSCVHSCLSSKLQSNDGSWWHDPLWSMEEIKAICLSSSCLWSKAYAHVPKDERGKLNSKTRKCILV